MVYNALEPKPEPRDLPGYARQGNWALAVCSRRGLSQGGLAGSPLAVSSVPRVVSSEQ
jgi:hypothetical protein